MAGKLIKMYKRMDGRIEYVCEHGVGQEDAKIICTVCGDNEAIFIQCESCVVKNKIKRNAIFKKRVFKERGKKCEMCGEGEKICMTIHHLDKKNHPYDIKKVRVLCLNCHVGKIHKQGRDD